MRVERQLAQLVAVGFFVGAVTLGCYPNLPHPSPPPPLVPTIVGVVWGWDNHGNVILVDERSVNDPETPDNLRMNHTPAPGDLLLARTTAPKFVDALAPINNVGSGCWEAYEGKVAWDMGTTIRFFSGIELPKAADFQAPASTMVYGHLGWADPPNELHWSFCANSSGEIDWGKPPQ